MKKILAGLFVVVAAVSFFACDDGIDYEKMRQEELAILNEYIEKNYPDLEPTSSGLYISNEAGTGQGDTIKAGDEVQLYYATWALINAEDSLLVDVSRGYLDGHRYEPLKVVVGAGSTISGLEEGLRYMQPGTKSHLVINSELAYGQSGKGAIGAFKTVLMEVEIYKVKPIDTGE